MSNVDRVLKDLCDLIESLHLKDRFTDEGFRISWSSKQEKVKLDIDKLNQEEYDYLEKRYCEWSRDHIGGSR